MNWPKSIALVALVVITLSLLWIAGEQHYQSCIDRAAAAPSTIRVPDPNDAYNTGRTVAADNPERERKLDGCSRLPL